MEDLADRIKVHEGFCGFPKYDAKGKWVIGFGHDITEEQAKDYASGIGMDEALDLLQSDIAHVKIACAHAMPWLLGIDDIRQQVIYEMAFQLGVNGVLGFKKMLMHLREGDYADAAREMLWNDTSRTEPTDWHYETPARCEGLAEIMLNGNLTT